MARPESLAVGGYYAFPPAHLGTVADLIDARAFLTGTGGHTLVALDPCAGDGHAIFTLLDHLGLSAALRATATAMPKAQVYAAEMEATRAAALAQRAKDATNRWNGGDTCLHGDMFTVEGDTTDRWDRYQGATLLWLNPPYDAERHGGRLEHRFLARANGWLAPEGVLAYVVPHYALDVSATLLAQHYDAVACYKLPEPDFSVYKQVVLLAQKRSAPLTLDTTDHPIAQQVRGWAANADSIPVLPILGTPVVRLPAAPKGGFTRWVLAPLDLTAVRETMRPWTVGVPGKESPAAGLGLERGMDDLIGRVHPVAMPLKAGHIAQIIAGDVMNGQRLDPDAPGLPPLLVKGTFEREFRTVDEKTNKKTGETTALIQVQQPKLRISVLDLASYTYHDLLPGSEPTGALVVAEMTVADILTRYGNALGALIERQCPPLHDPRRRDHQLAMPVMARTPFRAQMAATQGALKLLATGVNSFVLGEVGTGKSTITTLVAWALSPQHQAQTRSEMARVGLPWDTRLRPVRSILILCPPHLLTSWRNEVAAALPGASVVLLESPSDIPVRRATGTVADTTPGAGLTFYVLSRETAKLGHAMVSGLSGNNPECPRCGRPIVANAKEITAGRAVCPGDARPVPSDALAQRALDLTNLLVTAAPDAWLTTTLPPRNLQRLGKLTVTRAQQAQETPGGFYPAPAARWHARALSGAQDAQDGQDGLDGTPLATLLHALVGEAETRLAPKANGDPRPLMGVIARLLFSIDHAGRNALASGVLRRLYAATLHDRGGYGSAKDVRDWVRKTTLMLDPGAAQDALVAELRALADVSTDAGYGATGNPWGKVEKDIADLATERAGGRLYHANGYDSRDVKLVDGRLAWKVDYQTTYPLGDLAPTLDALTLLAEQGTFTRAAPCGERLYQASPNPRRYPLATFISRYRKDVFDLLVVDEGHEYNNSGTAQERAAHRLVELGLPTLVLSGSILSGYVSSLYANMVALSPAFRAVFGREGKADFVTRYGYRKRLVEVDPDQDNARRSYGSHSDRVTDSSDQAVTRALGEAPGVLPLFLLDWLLPMSVTIHKADLDQELPSFTEIPVSVPARSTVGRELLGRYSALQRAIAQQIAADRFEPGLAGRLFGALGQATTYLDRATEDTGNAPGVGGRVWEARYPEAAGGGLVHRAGLFPTAAYLPKEVWAIETIADELAEGRNVLLFVSNTGKDSGLAQRLRRLISADLGDIAMVLDSAKVDTRQRQDWITANVITPGKQVLIVNPVAIKTGLNNLVPHFSTAIWYQDPHADAITYRQANGRIHRIGQIHPVRVYTPVYALTAQELAMDLLGRKVSASLAIDGLDVTSALDAAGAGEAEDAFSVMELGRFIYEQLMGDGRLRQAA